MKDRNREKDVKRQAENLRERTRDRAATMFDAADAVDAIEIFKMFWNALEVIGDGLESMGGAFDGIDLGL